MDSCHFNLKGKKIVVTGASSGIGRATAILCSQLGAQVIALARRKEALEKTMSLITPTGRGGVLCGRFV